MVNTEDFRKRLEDIIQYYGLSASAFADKIGVQRSSISHILSGRNKPSLEFVMKIISNFPDVNLYWLLNGDGSFPVTKTESESSISENKNTSTPSEQKLLFTEENTITTPAPLKTIQPIQKNSKEKPIQKIIIFYTDGSFKAYETNLDA